MKSYSSKSKYTSSPDRIKRRSTSKDRKSKYSSYSKERSRRSRSDSRSRRRKRKYRNRSESTSSSSSSSSYERKEAKYKEKLILENLKLKKGDDEPKINSNVLDEINSDNFTPKQFNSSIKLNKKMDNIVIDLKSQTIKVPDVEITEPDSIFHPNVRYLKIIRYIF